MVFGSVVCVVVFFGLDKCLYLVYDYMFVVIFFFWLNEEFCFFDESILFCVFNFYRLSSFFFGYLKDYVVSGYGVRVNLMIIVFFNIRCYF